MHHRGGKFGKIVLKHHPLDGLVQALVPVEALDETLTVMPGIITSVRGRPVGPRNTGGLQIKVQYVAPDGHVRLIARLGNSVQEVRVTGSDPQTLLAKLQQIFPSN